MKILITWKKPYTFKADDGKVFEGMKVAYFNKNSSSKEGETGFNPILGKLPLSLDVKVSSIPGIYEADIEIQTNSKNQAEILFNDLELLKPVDFNNVFLLDNKNVK